jgi:hypothetical protein
MLAASYQRHRAPREARARAGLTFDGGVPAKPRRSARTSRCLTEEGCHRVPPRGLDLRSNLLQCAVRRGRGDAGCQPHQLPRRAVQQLRLDHALGDKPPDGAAEPFTVQLLSWPRFRTRTTSPQGWSGRFRRTIGNQDSDWARMPARWAASQLARILRIATGSPAAIRDFRRHALGGVQLVALRIGALLLGRHARIADQAAESGGFDGMAVGNPL